MNYFIDRVPFRPVLSGSLTPAELLDYRWLEIAIPRSRNLKINRTRSGVDDLSPVVIPQVRARVAS